MFFIVKTYMYLFGTTTNISNISFAFIFFTTAFRVSVLLAFVATHATRDQCEHSHRRKNCASTLKELTACQLISFVPWRHVNCNSSPVLEKSKLCEHVLPRRPHWLGTCSGEMLVVESLDGGPNLFRQFLEEALVEDCQVPHKRNVMHHVGSCLVLPSLQSTGDTHVSKRDPRNSARLQRWENQMFGSQTRTRVRLQKKSQGRSRPHSVNGPTRSLYCYAIARTLPSQALATHSDRGAQWLLSMHTNQGRAPTSCGNKHSLRKTCHVSEEDCTHSPCSTLSMAPVRLACLRLSVRLFVLQEICVAELSWSHPLSRVSVCRTTLMANQQANSTKSASKDCSFSATNFAYRDPWPPCVRRVASLARMYRFDCCSLRSFSRSCSSN